MILIWATWCCCQPFWPDVVGLGELASCSPSWDDKCGVWKRCSSYIMLHPIGFKHIRFASNLSHMLIHVWTFLVVLDTPNFSVENLTWASPGCPMFPPPWATHQASERLQGWGRSARPAGSATWEFTKDTNKKEEIELPWNALKSTLLILAYLGNMWSSQFCPYFHRSGWGANHP